MPHTLKLGFTSFARLRGVLITFCGENLKFGPATQKALSPLGDLDKDEERLALARDQVEVAHRLREPEHDGQADEDKDERTHRGAKDVATDRPHRIGLPRGGHP